MSISVPRCARSDYVLARAYLSRDVTQQRLFRRLDESARHFRLTIDHRNDDHFDPQTNTIAWDPYSALRTTRGGTQSPALGLGHEIAHAVEAPSREATLARHTPSVAGVATSPDSPLVNRLTTATLYTFSLTQGNQDANVFLVLEPFTASATTSSTGSSSSSTGSSSSSGGSGSGSGSGSSSSGSSLGTTTTAKNP